MLSDLVLMPILRFEMQSVVRAAVLSARENTFDFSNLLIACVAKALICEGVLTFDQEASQYFGFQLLGPSSSNMRSNRSS